MQESKQSGILGILQVKQLLMSIITQIYRFVQWRQETETKHLYFTFFDSSEEECEDIIELVMKGYNLDLYEVTCYLVSFLEEHKIVRKETCL